MSCGVKILVNPSIASPSWDTPQFAPDGAPWRIEGDSWRAVLIGLQPSSRYTLRVYGTNAAGDGKEVRQDIDTLSVPEAPTDLTRGCGSSGALCLEWNVSDPVGAPVTSCEVEISGSLWWTACAFADGPRRLMDQKWTASL